MVYVVHLCSVSEARRNEIWLGNIHYVSKISCTSIHHKLLCYTYYSANGQYCRHMGWKEHNKKLWADCGCCSSRHRPEGGTQSSEPPVCQNLMQRKFMFLFICQRKVIIKKCMIMVSQSILTFWLTVPDCGWEIKVYLYELSWNCYIFPI